MLRKRTSRAKPAGCNQLILSKRGIYLVWRRGKLRSFRLITWEQMLARLDGC